MGKGVVRIELEVFRDLLKLPEEYKPLHAFVTLEDQFVCLVVEHPDLPDNKDSLTGSTHFSPISLSYEQYYVPESKIVRLAGIHIPGADLKFSKRGNDHE